MNDALRDLGVIGEEVAPLSEARLRVAELRDVYGLTDTEIAKATDADPRTVARWRSQDGLQRASRYDKPIERLLEIIDALRPILGNDPRAVREFLRGKNRYLDGARPLNLLGAGRYVEVREAITQRRGGDPVRKKKNSPTPTGEPAGKGELGSGVRGSTRHLPVAG
jgi:hypothetical protein